MTDLGKPPDTNGKKVQKVFISNLSEDVWPFIESFSDPQAKKTEIEENASLADRDIFSMAQESNVVFILPKPISEEFLNYYFSIFGKKNIEILVPNVHTGRICDDILSDTFCYSKLLELGKEKKLSLIPYSTSQYFLNLVESLRKDGLEVLTPESPEEEDAWTVNFFGSKSGIRQLSQQSKAEEPDLIMSDGFICVGIEDAARIAAKKFIKENAVVVKTNKGHSGAGVLILKKEDLPHDYSQAEKKILSTLKKNLYWEKFPIVIESFVNFNANVAGGFPNVEFRIQKNGQIDLLYFCGMRVEDGVFKGIEINEDVVSDRIEAQITDTGFYLGEKYVQNGYRGYFDVDFAISKNGKVYLTESNVRRTGGTHVYQSACELFGEDFYFDTYTLSNNLYSLPQGKEFTFSSLTGKLSHLLFNKKKREGVIIVSENLLKQNKLAYIIFGLNKKRALEIEREMEKLLSS